MRHSSCRFAEPGPYRTPEFVTAPALQRTAPRRATRCAASGAQNRIYPRPETKPPLRFGKAAPQTTARHQGGKPMNMTRRGLFATAGAAAAAIALPRGAGAQSFEFKPN